MYLSTPVFSREYLAFTKKGGVMEGKNTKTHKDLEIWKEGIELVTKIYKLTKDLKARIKMHNGGKVKSTRNRTPFKLIYYEACLNQKDALKKRKVFKD